MDLLTIVRILLRRWYVTVPAVVATLVAAGLLQANVPAQYRVQGSVLIVDPQQDPSLGADPDRLISLAAEDLEEAELPNVDRDETDLVAGPVGNATIEVNATSNTPRAAERAVLAAIDFLEVQIEAEKVASGGPADEGLQPQLLTPAVIAEAIGDDRYRAAASLTLLDTLEGAVNPYTAGGLTIRLLEVAAMSDAGRIRVASLTSGVSEYTVTGDAFDAAPIMSIEIVGEDAGEALAAFDAIRDLLAAELTDRQARSGVPAARQLTVETLAQPQRAIDESPPLDRVTAMVVVLGLLTTVGLALAVESILQRHRAPYRGGAPDIDGIRPDWWPSQPDVEPPPPDSDVSAR